MDAALRFGNRLLLRRFRFFRFGMQFLARLIRHDKRHRIAPQFVEIERRQLLRKRLLLLHILFLHLRDQAALLRGARQGCPVLDLSVPVFETPSASRGGFPPRTHPGASGRFSLSGLCLLHRQRRLVHWKIKLRRLRARRRSCSCCTCSMCRVATWLTIRSAGSGCSQLRLVVFNSGAVFDRGNDSAHRHIQAR